MVDECFRCGVDENHALLFETIGDEGIVKVCRKCSLEIDSPIIKQPSQEKLRESQVKKSVYEKLSSVAGLDAEEHRKKLAIEEKKKEIFSEQEQDLKELVRKNLGSLKKEHPDKFVDNFHWVLMRVRRSKKITQKELAKEIGEPEDAIKMLESGILPKGNEIIIKKIENYFGINIFKKDVEQPQKSSVEVDKMRMELMKKVEEEPKEIFDRKNPNQLMISDLKEMQKKVDFKPNPRIFEKQDEPVLMIKGEEIKLCEEEITKSDEPEFVEGEEKDFIGKPFEEQEEKKDLTDEEIDDLIFGGRGD